MKRTFPLIPRLTRYSICQNVENFINRIIEKHERVYPFCINHPYNFHRRNNTFFAVIFDNALITFFAFLLFSSRSIVSVYHSKARAVRLVETIAETKDLYLYNIFEVRISNLFLRNK